MRLATSTPAEGTLAHLTVAVSLLGGPINADAEGYAHAALAFLAAADIEPVGVEVPVYRPGRYGGYIDCVAEDRAGDLVAIDWKTGAAGPQAALQLTAYLHAGRALDVTGTTRWGDEDISSGTSSAYRATEFSACWVVALTSTRWVAYGFSPSGEPGRRLRDAYRDIFLRDEAPTRRCNIARWWDMQLGPESN